MRILAYLYRGSWANNYTIRHRTNVPSQDHNRFKEFLEELYIMGCLEKDEEETGGVKARPIYRITQFGREAVDVYRGSTHLSKIFGSIEDVFDR